MKQISLLRIPNTGTIVIKKINPTNLFISTNNSIVISEDGLFFLLNALLEHKLIDKEVLERELNLGKN